MFLMMGVMPRQKQIGTVGNYMIYSICNAFTLFFIPIFRWGKRYIAVSPQNQVYEISDEVGRRIEDGETVSESELGINTRQYGGFYSSGSAGTAEEGDRTASTGAEVKICMRCGFETDELSFEHCPKCGNKLRVKDW